MWQRDSSFVTLIREWMLMYLSLAPMEGITGHVFRRVHAECFGALDCYYTPFLPPPWVATAWTASASNTRPASASIRMLRSAISAGATASP